MVRRARESKNNRYEFHLTLECNRDTYRAEVITKRGSMLPDMRPVELSVELGERLATWAESGIVTPEDTEVKLVLQLKEFYPGGGKQVAAMLKQLGLTYTVELHDDTHWIVALPRRREMIGLMAGLVEGCIFPQSQPSCNPARRGSRVYSH